MRRSKSATPPPRQCPLSISYGPFQVDGMDSSPYLLTFYPNLRGALTEKSPTQDLSSLSRGLPDDTLRPSPAR